MKLFVMYLVAFAVLAVCPMAHAESKQATDVLLLRALSSFHRTFSHDLEAAKREATAIDKALTSDGSQTRFSPYYAARVAYVLGNRDRAGTVARDVLKDATDINAPDAAWLLEQIRLGNIAASQPSDPSSWWKQNRSINASLAKYFPHGFYADQVMFDKAADMSNARAEAARANKTPFFQEPWHTKEPIREIFALKSAGDSFAKMVMYSRSVDAYRTAIGFLPAEEWVSPRTSDIWFGMGQSYEFLGQLAESKACYIKAVASGARPADVIPHIVSVQADLDMGKKPAIRAEQPDVEGLLTIAKIFANTDLFVDAEVTARVAESQQAGSGSKLVKQIREAHASRIEELLPQFEGAVFRGVPVTRDKIQELRQ